MGQQRAAVVRRAEAVLLFPNRCHSVLLLQNFVVTTGLDYSVALSRAVPLETGLAIFAFTLIMATSKSSDTHELSHLIADLLNWECREKPCNTYASKKVEYDGSSG